MTITQMEAVLQALKNPSLQSKDLSMDDLLTLISIQMVIAAEFETLLIAEQTTVKDFGVELQDNRYISQNPEFYKRLAEIKTKDKEIPGLNFIEKSSFYKFVSTLDFQTTSLLAEFFLKK